MIQQIQATITGYGGRACTLFSALNSETKVLIFGAEADFRVDRRAGCIVLTNDPAIPRDSLFQESDLKAAITAFFALKSGYASDAKTPRMAFSERAARANPEQSIEKDGMDSSGPRYRIADGVSCSQMAALATCLYASRADTVDVAVKMAQTFRHFGHGGIITI